MNTSGVEWGTTKQRVIKKQNSRHTTGKDLEVNERVQLNAITIRAVEGGIGSAISKVGKK